MFQMLNVTKEDEGYLILVRNICYGRSKCTFDFRLLMTMVWVGLRHT